MCIRDREFAAYLKTKGIQHRVKAPHDVNSIAVVDRKIQSTKKAISGAMMEDEMSEVSVNWVRLLEKIVAGLNESPTEALHGKAPEDITDEKAIFDIQKAQAERATKAVDKFHKQVDAVEASGKVRTLLRDAQTE